MLPHPIFTSRLKMIAATSALLLAVVTFSVLLWQADDSPVSYLILYSCISAGLLAAIGFGFWYFINLLQFPQAYWLLSVPTWLVWLALSLLFSMALPISMQATATVTLCMGIWLWLGLLLWYRVEYWQNRLSERLVDEVAQAPLSQIADRITVKAGSRIHIIRVQDIHYVQACGDYVMLVTAEGEFLKEQTMKSLEEHLPDIFVRIHRSYIVNIEQIIRTELFGKESYNLHLRSGVVLRASAKGYKALREKLDI